MADISKFDLNTDKETNDPNSLILFDNNVLQMENYQSELFDCTLERDPNKMTVCIADTAPVVILFGAQCSGKTMTLVRLTRYLNSQGYKVNPDRIFRPASSTHYQVMCDNFDKAIYSDMAANGTSISDSILVRIQNKYRNTICQILDASGVHYFDNNESDRSFPCYIIDICSCKNPKIWIFFIEKDWKDADTRRKYVQKIINMQDLIYQKDKIIFMCPKADLHPEYCCTGTLNKKGFFKAIKNEYPGIFSIYKNENLIARLFSPHKFDFVVFSAGTFFQHPDVGPTYIQSEDKYPAALWKTILKNC